MRVLFSESTVTMSIKEKSFLAFTREGERADELYIYKDPRPIFVTDMLRFEGETDNASSFLVQI